MDEPLPVYAYVPGGPYPRPTEERTYHGGESTFRRGVALFDGGFYWEAHEAWEALWHAEGRNGSIADLLKALIKLAAAGVKVRQGQPHGVAVHASRAVDLIHAVCRAVGNTLLDLDLARLELCAAEIVERPPSRPDPGARVARVFDWTLCDLSHGAKDTP